MMPGSEGESGRSTDRDLANEAKLPSGEIATDETVCKTRPACAADIADDELWHRFAHEPVFPIVTLLGVSISDD